MFTGVLNANLWAVRATDKQANTFNDWVGITYQFAEGEWCQFAFPATTDPGTYWRLNPMNVKGTAVLKPGRYPGAYKVGTHKGYTALQQKRPVTIWRDANRNSELDIPTSIEETGMFGLNIHRASSTGTSGVVEKWSAGCQVLADYEHFAFLMAIARRSSAKYGNSFTFVLLDEAKL